MSGDELLARATRALRDATEPDPELDAEAGVAATTLARVERSTRGRRTSSARRRAYARWIVTPLAASFVVFAAWASASGRLAQWVGARAHDEAERAAGEAPTDDPPRAPARATTATPEIPEPSADDAPSADDETPDAAAPSADDATPAPAPSAATSPKRPPAGADADALYRDAHDAHFVRRDPAAALAAWDRYLAAAGPSGRFALEARYNRALALVRLGRRDEAAAALRPFAGGEYGGYRRDEAARLLRSLE